MLKLFILFTLKTTEKLKNNKCNLFKVVVIYIKIINDFHFNKYNISYFDYLY